METRANYALIGAFTIAMALAAFGFVYWFSGPSKIGKQQFYQIVFSGSVSGLTQGSSVLFNGLKVGEVTRLQIDQHDPSKVDALIRIDGGAPVKTNTQARLETRGFTGVADVLLVGQRAPRGRGAEGCPGGGPTGVVGAFEISEQDFGGRGRKHQGDNGTQNARHPIPAPYRSDAQSPHRTSKQAKGNPGNTADPKHPRLHHRRAAA